MKTPRKIATVEAYRYGSYWTVAAYRGTPRVRAFISDIAVDDTQDVPTEALEAYARYCFGPFGRLVVNSR